MKKSTPEKVTKSNSDYIKLFWKIFLGGVLAVALLFFLASVGALGKMPSFEELENPDSNIATEIISADGKVIGKFYKQNRVPIKFNDLPDHLVNALIATEDERYYEHSGIDGRGTVRAFAKLGTDGGASTITQQLAKLLFNGEGSKNKIERGLQKIKEWIIAVRLERQYTKKEIIALYLNQVDFVNGAVGISSAARIYFNKTPKELSLQESALLVGMLKNPSLYNPNRKEQSRKLSVFYRRNTVLGQMKKNNFITEAEETKYAKDSIVLDFKPESHNAGIATYFREYLREYMKNWVKENPKADGTKYNIYSDGLKIYTTIDSRMQHYAEEAVEEHLVNLQKLFFEREKRNKNAPFHNITKEQTNGILNRAMKSSERWRLMKSEGKTTDEILASFDKKASMKVFTWKGERDTIMTPKDSILYYKHFLQTGLVAMEPQTGHIKAWVGGINQKYFQYDHAGVGARQVGSTFKPFVYATAIEQLGMSPCDSIFDSPHTIPRGKWGNAQSWTPKNSGGGYRGLTNLKVGLANSINTISAKLMDRVGPKAVVDMAHNLGITTEIPKQPAIALGAVEITVKEMVGAYSTFANKGVYIEPSFITKITDKNGVILDQIIPESRDIVNQDVAYAVVKLMEGVTQDGSGKRLRTGNVNGITSYSYKHANDIAGKTGTTQNNSDGWFIGMVPNLTTGVWVGNEDRAAHFSSTLYGQGAAMALPIWGIFMDKCYKDTTLSVSKESFERPEEMTIKVDCWKNTTVIDSTRIDEPMLDEFEY